MPKDAGPARDAPGPHGDGAKGFLDRHGRLLLALAVVAIVAGAALRVAAPFAMDFRQDGATYVALGRSVAVNHDLTLPYGDPTVPNPSPAPSHHYPPGYPVYLGLFFMVFGYGLVQAKLAAALMGLVSLAVVFLTTRDLYGRLPAALVTGIVALEPHLVWSTGVGFSENMALAAFALTMWAIVKSLERPRFIVLAGLFAGLAYLTRASMGWFFLVAGLGGFAWRFYYKRWKVFTDRWYLAAAGVFLLIVLAWAARNVALFGWPNWQTSAYVSYVTDHAVANPDLFFKALAQKTPLFLGYFAVYAAPFVAYVAASFRRVREEATSVLWVSVILVWALGLFMSALFWTWERTPMYWHDNHRYVLVGLVPLGWLVVREARPNARLLMAWTLLAIVLGSLAATIMVNPTRFSEARAAEYLDPYVRPGDEILVLGHVKKYSPYPYLADPDSVRIYPIQGAAGRQPTFIVTGIPIPPIENYTLVAKFRQTYVMGTTNLVNVFAHDAVIDARRMEPQLPAR